VEWTPARAASAAAIAQVEGEESLGGDVSARLEECAIKCLNNRSLCAAQLHAHADVVRDASAVLARRPGNVKALLRRAFAQEAVEQFTAALADVQAALGIEPTCAPANEALARLRSAAAAQQRAKAGAGGEGGGAATTSTTTAASASAGGVPSTPAPPAQESWREFVPAAEAHKEAGTLAFKAGDYAAAAAEYREALRADPTSHVLESNLSIALLKLGKADEAHAAAKRCVDLEPTFPKGWYRLGQAHQALGHLSQASAAYERGLRVSPAGASQAEFEKGLRTLNTLGLDHSSRAVREAEQRAKAEEEERAKASAAAAAKARKRREASQAGRDAGSDNDASSDGDEEDVPVRARGKAGDASATQNQPAVAPPIPEKPSAATEAGKAAVDGRAAGAGDAGGGTAESGQNVKDALQASPQAQPPRRAVDADAAARLAERISQTAPAVPPRPRTTVEFERTWRTLWRKSSKGRDAASAPTLRSYLEHLAPADLATFFGENLSDETLETLALAARGLYLHADSSAGGAPRALSLLCGLARVRRVDMVWMLAGKEAKLAAGEVFAAGAQPEAPFGPADVEVARRAFA